MSADAITNNSVSLIGQPNTRSIGKGHDTVVKVTGHGDDGVQFGQAFAKS